jgi:hypothetical protein
MFEVKSNKDRTLICHASLLGCIDDGQHFCIRKEKRLYPQGSICYGKTVTDDGLRFDPRASLHFAIH